MHDRPRKKKQKLLSKTNLQKKYCFFGVTTRIIVDTLNFYKWFMY